jgi:hypothetical protein
MSSVRPYYRRHKPGRRRPHGEAAAQPRDFVDFSGIDIPLPGRGDHVGAVVKDRDARAAAVLAAIVGDIGVNPLAHTLQDLWESADPMTMEANRCLAALAYLDYYTTATAQDVKRLVADAIREARPGWSGTFSGGVSQLDLVGGDTPEGNYDMGQMCQAALAYAFFDELGEFDAAGREHLIRTLLGNAKIWRLNLPTLATSGPLPTDWMRAGYLSYGYLTGPMGGGPDINAKDIGETENHILAMTTARYLANQLLFQRTHDERYDNRRNGKVPTLFTPGIPSCTTLLLWLMRNILNGDFSEYNAKNYQNEARWALLALDSFSYDYEVRLSARIVLDYLSAKMAVSSNDLRRLVPFRRRNEGVKIKHSSKGKMQVGLISISDGADPMLMPFALQTGNIRACRREGDLPGLPGTQKELALETVADYRIPPSILDLFVNNTSRRFFQRLHREKIGGEPGGNRNADNMEIYAGSASYLITAGGEPADYAIDPRISWQTVGGVSFGVVGGILGGIGGAFVGGAVGGPLGAVVFGLAGIFGGHAVGLTAGRIAGSFIDLFSDGFVFQDTDQQKGVAVTTSFMPATGVQAIGIPVINAAEQLIQLCYFSDDLNAVSNYGVAPDFACGYSIGLPAWLESKLEPDGDDWYFGNFGSSKEIFDKRGRRRRVATEPGFYIALLRQRDDQNVSFVALEAFDTLLDASLAFDRFRTDVRNRNSNIRLGDLVPDRYVTTNGNVIDFVIRRNGAEVTAVRYADPDSPDARGDAGNAKRHLLNGTILNTESDAVVTIDNPALGTRIRLDLSDPTHPQRTAEDGSIESAGANEEVWTDFDWQGNQEGDVYRPISTLAAATAAVRDGGTIRMIPSQSAERSPIGNGKTFTLVAPIGDVKIGVK